MKVDHEISFLCLISRTWISELLKSPNTGILTQIGIIKSRKSLLIIN